MTTIKKVNLYLYSYPYTTKSGKKVLVVQTDTMISRIYKEIVLTGKQWLNLISSNKIKILPVPIHLIK